MIWQWLRGTRGNSDPKVRQEQLSRKYQDVGDSIRKISRSLYAGASDEELRKDALEFAKLRHKITRAYSDGYAQNDIRGTLYALVSPRSMYREVDITESGVNVVGHAVIRDLLPNFEREITESPAETLAQLNLIRMNATFGPRSERMDGIRSLERLIHSIDVLARGEDDAYMPAVGLASLVEQHGSPDSQLRAREVMRSVFDASRGDLKKMANLIAYGFHSKEFIRPYLDEILGKAELPYEETTEAWLKSAHFDNYQSVIVSNIVATRELEEKRPGACAYLRSEFGILDFGRYPTDLLIKQCEEAEDVDTPYGIVVLPRGDWNDSFYRYTSAFKRFHRQLNGKVRLRFVEADSKFDLARQLISLDNKYGENGKRNKISFAIIGGHGTKDSLNFGGRGDRHKLLTKDFEKPGVQRTSSFFETHATILLLSCSTGEEGGIAQELANGLRLKVKAPDRITGLRDMGAEVDANNVVDLSVTYSSATTKTYLPSEQI